MSKERADIKTRFKGKGIGLKHKQKVVATALPPDLDVLVRAKPNISEFIREAIAEKLEKEGLISNSESA